MSKRSPAPASATIAALLNVSRNAKGEIRSHLRGMWLVETPEERVRQEHREQEVDRVLQRAPAGEDASLVQARGTAKTALEQPLDGSEQVLHVHGLRTRPPAPHAPEQRGEEVFVVGGRVARSPMIHSSWGPSLDW